MNNLIEVSAWATDLTAEDGWKLVEWCYSKGADEFSLFRFPREGSSKERFQEFDRLVEPFRHPPAIRRSLYGDAEPNPSTELCELWALNSTTIAALGIAFPGGIFEYSSDFEDLILFRSSELLLGVITHEPIVVLRMSPADLAELANAGFSSLVNVGEGDH